MNGIESNYQNVLSTAEEKLKHFLHVPNHQWTTVNNNDDTTTNYQSLEIYTHAVESMTGYKAVLKLPNVNLDQYSYLLSCVELHSNWCHLYQDITLLDKPATNINLIHAKSSIEEKDVYWVEGITTEKKRVGYIASTSDPNEHFMALDICDSIMTAYYYCHYQSNEENLNTLKDLIKGLVELRNYPWISHCDRSIKATQTNAFEYEYVYVEDEEEEQFKRLKAPPMDIRQKIGHSKWHSGSWDHYQDITNQTIGGSAKLLSSSLLFSSNNRFATTVGQQSSSNNSWNNHMDEDQIIEEAVKYNSNSELRIEIVDIPELSITLPDYIEYSNKFAQLCTRLYKKPHNKTGYILQIIHPYNLSTYLSNQDHHQEVMKLDDDEEEDDNDDDNENGMIRVQLSIKKSTDSRFIVNNNEWPIRLWTLSSDEDEQDGLEEESPDIFVDGMEELNVLEKSPSPQKTIETITVKEDILPTEELPKVVNSKNNEEIAVTVDDTRSAIEIPDTDPTALQKIYSQFNQYLDPNYTSNSTLAQYPSKENGHIPIKKITAENHPLGGFLSESTWKNCSIWDIKSVLESTGARKFWDSTFESSILLHALTATSSIWHTKIKGAWPVNPRDYVSFYGQYTTPYSIDLLSTSCFGDSYQYKSLPKEVPGYIRSTLDLMGWRLERIDSQTVSVKQVLLTQFPTWTINYITSRYLVQSCAAVQNAREYFELYGAPPSLETLTCATLVNLKHDHEPKNWRCEYLRHTTETEAAQSVKPKTVSYIRLDKRRWAGAHNGYNIVVDPPPSKTFALEKVHDSYGVWLTIEHEEAFIIPLRGKILVLIKPDHTDAPQTADMQQKSRRLKVNGASIDIEKETHTVDTFTETVIQHLDKNIEQQSKRMADPIVLLTEEEKMTNLLDELVTLPKTRAQAALMFLKHADEQFGWSVISDNNKSGIRISKKPGVKNQGTALQNKKDDHSSVTTVASTSTSTIVTSETGDIIDNPIKPSAPPNSEAPATTYTEEERPLQVPEPYMIYKGSKVIENFSVDEVLSIVTDIGNVRKSYDDTLEYVRLIKQIEPGCRMISQSIKAIFPLKNREIYATSCLAQETSPLSTSQSKRTLYVESSLPDLPNLNNKKPRGNLFISGWILEAIDPYTTTTNHPIPSTRVTYVAALDLGQSVPSYISNLVANNWFPKRIQAVESYLKLKGPIPYVTLPNPAFLFSNNKLLKNTPSADEDESNHIKWVDINSHYDKDTGLFTVKNKFMPLENEKKKTGASLPSNAKDSGSNVLSSPSTSSSTSLLRRPSNHTISSSFDAASRRGSLSLHALPKKHNVGTIVTNTSNTDKTDVSLSKTTRSITLLRTTFDLRSYPKGYELKAQLYEISEKGSQKRNVSNKMTMCVTEPSLSQLMDDKTKKPLIKHSVVVTAQSLMEASKKNYEFEYSLAPVSVESLQNRSTRLTVSQVLGEDEDENNRRAWKGMVVVNGIEVNLGREITLKSLESAEEANTSSSSNSVENIAGKAKAESKGDSSNKDDERNRSASKKDDKVSLASNHNGSDDESFSEASNTMQYMGGGVVAAAFGNVSAGVNNFGARMMIPFRAASTSFFDNNMENEQKPKATVTNEKFGSKDLEESSDDEDENSQKKRRFTRDEKRTIVSNMTLHEVRLLRRSRDTMRKGMLLLCICLGLAVVFALLMLQPMLERYYTSFIVSSTLESLDQSVENGIVRRLMQIPWFGGWNIQIIAVRR